MIIGFVAVYNATYYLRSQDKCQAIRHHFLTSLIIQSSRTSSAFYEVAAAMQPGEVMDADANTGWIQHDAIRVVDAVCSLSSEHNISLYIEQPCLNYEECLNVRQHTHLPMILDECMDGMLVLLRRDWVSNRIWAFWEVRFSLPDGPFRCINRE